MEEENEEDQSSLTEAQQDYKARLHFLQQNEMKRNWFGCSSLLYESQWTIDQWNVFLTALLKNTSVESLVVGIDVIPVECLVLFKDYIRMSHNLNDLTIRYEPEDDDLDEEPMPHYYTYLSKIDETLGAVRHNPAIKKLTLHCLGNPQSIQDFLTGNETINTFTLQMESTQDVPMTMAKSIAADLQGNKELRELVLYVRTCHLDIIVSGLCHHGNDDSLSSLESLTLWTNQPESNPELGANVLEAIKCCPSLKKLTVKTPDYSWNPNRLGTAQPWVDHVLKNLHHPECAGLETLWLDHLTLGTSSQANDNSADTTVAPVPDWIVPMDQANKTLKEVTLDRVTFVHEQTVQLFYNLRGLTRLRVYESNGDIVGAAEEESPGVDERTGAGEGESDDVVEAKDDGDHVQKNNHAIDYWARFIHQCIDLRQAHILVIYMDDIQIGYRSRMLESVLNGARGHKALEELKLQLAEVEIPRGRLRSLLQQLLLETTCLKCLEIDDIGHHEDLAVGLAGGLRGNKSLEKLAFEMPITDVPDAAHMITIRVLEGLLENHTLQRLCDDSRYDWDFDRQYDSDQSQQICDALVRVFRVNKSLRHISLPTLDLRQGRMRSLLEGLGQNTTLTSLDMSNCQADAPCFALLEQSLVGKKTIPVEHIVLPRFSTAHSSGSLSTDIESFMHSIVHMRRVKAIDFCTDSWPINDGDRMNCLKLLLRAAKENKYIHSFGSDLDELEENDGCIELHSDIKYYLKLNSFGRHGLDSTNLRRSLWPAILAHMTTKAEDTDALFFFIREFFMRHSYPLRWQREQDMPLPKRARLDM